MTPPEPTSATADLFADQACTRQGTTQVLAEGAVLLCGFALSYVKALLDGVQRVTEAAPFRHMLTPGGYSMSVAMSNCGPLGWVADRQGYRYSEEDPESGRPWPAMPDAFMLLAQEAAAKAGFAGFQPDACLINRYAPGAKLSMHQDKDEEDMSAPIVSVSLGLPAVFALGGLKRKDAVQRIALQHGDVVVFGGSSRLCHHAVSPVKDGVHVDVGPYRINLTFRQAKAVRQP